jgi:hypothetical protein
MTDEPAHSLAEGSAAAAISRGRPGCLRPSGPLVFADRGPRPGVSSYPAWVDQNSPLPARLGRYATLLLRTEWR